MRFFFLFLSITSFHICFAQQNITKFNVQKKEASQKDSCNLLCISHIEFDSLSFNNIGQLARWNLNSTFLDHKRKQHTEVEWDFQDSLLIIESKEEIGSEMAALEYLYSDSLTIEYEKLLRALDSQPIMIDGNRFRSLILTDQPFGVFVSSSSANNSLLPQVILVSEKRFSAGIITIKK